MEENTVLREDIPAEAIKVLGIKGIANTSLEMIAKRMSCPTGDLKRFWPNREVLLYDALCYPSQQVDVWCRWSLLGDTLNAEQKLLTRYAALTTCVSNHRYPGRLFIAACTFYPDPQRPIHQLVEQQKRASLIYTHELLTQLKVDDPEMVAKRTRLIVEGCLSRLLIKHNRTDVGTAQQLVEDILHFAQYRIGGVLA